MDENTREEHDVEEPTPTLEAVGRRLRSAREGKGLSLEEAARELHLAAPRVEALEEGNPDELPPAAFVTGYIRNYARLLGLPTEELVDEYSRALGNKEPTLHVTIGGEEQVKSSDTPVRVVTYLIVLGLVILAGAWWWTQRAPLQQTADEEPPARIEQGGTADLEVPKDRRPAKRDAGGEEAASAEPEAAEEPAAEGGPSVVEILKQRAAEAPPEERVEPEPPPAEAGRTETAPSATEEPASTDETVTAAAEPAEPESATDAAPQVEATSEPPSETLPEPEPTPRAAADAAPLPPEAPQAELVLTFDNDCWTEVTDAEGRRLLYALVSSGSRRVLRGEAPFEVFLGYAPGVTVRYEGEMFDHSRFQHQDIARFTVGEPEDNQPLTDNE